MESITLTDKQIVRYPRLDTVLAIEEFIRQNDGEYKKRALWEHLPKKMMYQTFNLTLNYLYNSRKISIDAEGKIGWIHYPKLVAAHNKKPLGRK
jgi:hypothetical protein